MARPNTVPTPTTKEQRDDMRAQLAALGVDAPKSVNGATLRALLDDAIANDKLSAENYGPGDKYHSDWDEAIEECATRERGKENDWSEAIEMDAERTRVRALIVEGNAEYRAKMERKLQRARSAAASEARRKQRPCRIVFDPKRDDYRTTIYESAWPEFETIETIQPGEKIARVTKLAGGENRSQSQRDAIRRAFIAWSKGLVQVVSEDGAWQYKIKGTGNRADALRPAPWNDIVREAFAAPTDFAEAAKAWQSPRNARTLQTH